MDKESNKSKKVNDPTPVGRRKAGKAGKTGKAGTNANSRHMQHWLDTLFMAVIVSSSNLSSIHLAILYIDYT